MQRFKRWLKGGTVALIAWLLVGVGALSVPQQAQGVFSSNLLYMLEEYLNANPYRLQIHTSSFCQGGIAMVYYHPRPGDVVRRMGSLYDSKRQDFFVGGQRVRSVSVYDNSTGTGVCLDLDSGAAFMVPY